LLLQTLPLVHLMQHDPDAAQSFLTLQAEKLGPGFSTAHFVLMIRSVDVLLYQGRAVAALACVRDHWEPLKRSLLYRGRMTRASAHLARARAALMTYRETREAALLSDIADDVEELRQLGPGYAGFAPALEGQIAVLKGNLALARAFFEAALQQFSKEQSDHAVLYVRYRLGELLGDLGGQAMQRNSRETLERQGIVDVEAFLHVVMPISSLQP
jgi:hypothetical protein